MSNDFSSVINFFLVGGVIYYKPLFAYEFKDNQLTIEWIQEITAAEIENILELLREANGCKASIECYENKEMRRTIDLHDIQLLKYFKKPKSGIHTITFSYDKNNIGFHDYEGGHLDLSGRHESRIDF